MSFGSRIYAMAQYLMKGTTFRLISELDISRDPRSEEYLLAEVHMQDFVFQIIGLTGHHAGSLYGFIRKDPLAVKDRIIGVTPEHLLNEVHRNFMLVEGSYQVVNVRLASPMFGQDTSSSPE